MTPIRVMVADDEALTRYALRTLLEERPAVTFVGEAADGSEAVELCAAAEPEVVLMDYRMPVTNGLEATAAIVAAYPSTRVLMVTSCPTQEQVVAAIRAGASGYLSKDCTPEELIDAIGDVHGGAVVFSPAVARHVRSALCDDAAAQGGAVSRDLGLLTARELAVVRVLARGLSNEEIAEELGLAQPTVKSYLGSVISKWGVRDRVQVLVEAGRRGLVTF